MDQFLVNLVQASIHGSVVILAVILLRLLLRKAPKKYICLLWLLAGIRLLLPIEIRSELSLQPTLTLPAAGLSNLPWAHLLPWVWAAVALCFGLYSLVSYRKLKRKVREAVRIRGGWECDKIDTAFILGFIRPRIYIPMGMTRQAQKHILEHERTHLDKGDHWIKMIGFLALALHWFNPLVWVAYILLCKDIEMACDERVIQFMELEERKSYSAALLSCSSRQLHFSANPVAFGEVSVKKRIVNVLNYKKPSFWFSLLGVAAFFFAAICLVTSPESNNSSVKALTPQEQAQQACIQKCQEDVEAAFAKKEFLYEINSASAQGNVGWTVRIYKQGENTMWTYLPGNRDEITEGRLVLDGQQYAWQSGSWIKTDALDDGLEAWLSLFRWDISRTEFISKDIGDTFSKLTFTFCWDGADKTVHTATAVCTWGQDDGILSLAIDQPNHETADKVYLMFDSGSSPYSSGKTVSDFFREAEAAIGEGAVTADELAEQAEIAKWDILFRVDNDRLSGRGADVYFSQGKDGVGVISTTEAYWLEQKVDGKWVMLSPISEPVWSDSGIGVAKEMATYGYLDWSPVYGELEAGEYRMGKRFLCYDGYSKEELDFYSEFTIYQSVDDSSPEAKAAVERCYAELEKLKSRDTIHWRTVMNQDGQREFWVNGKDYLSVSHWSGPEKVPQEEWSEYEKSLFPRVDTFAQYDGVRYATARKNPEVLSSEAIGMCLTSFEQKSWTRETIAEDYIIGFFERGNHTITFPEGVGVVSDEMVRFCQTWKVVGLSYDEASAQITYRFDQDGNLCYMAYETDLQTDHPYCASIEVFGDTAEEIDAIIKPYTENLIVPDFSWEEAKAKYTGGEFNIRQDGFVCTGGSPITGPVEAARLALKEYPNLGEYLSIDVLRDRNTGMWKVTVKSYVEYERTYAYRDIYLSGIGATQLLVYEGPVRFDESRK